MAPKSALGKGLEALLPEGAEVLQVPLERIQPGRQPRQRFDEQALRELAQSIRARGVLQPLLCSRAEGGKFRLIAGERRLRAAQMAGLRSVPVILREATEAEALQLALVENIQREDLNPLETARALRALSEEFGLSQEELAQRLGKDRSSVANYLRLLRLPEDVQALLEAGRLQMGHARALLGLPSAELQRRAAQAVLQEGLSVRRTEALVRRALSSVSRKATIKPKKRTIVSKSDPNIQTLQEQLSSHLGLRVRLQHRAPGGVVEIHYSSLEELQGLLQRLLS